MGVTCSVVHKPIAEHFNFLSVLQTTNNNKQQDKVGKGGKGNTPRWGAERMHLTNKYFGQRLSPLV